MEATISLPNFAIFVNREKHTMKWNFQNMAYGSDTGQTLDLILPKQKVAQAIVYIHGGAYLVGDKTEYPSFLADYTEDTVFAAINYRLVQDNNNVRMNDILSDVDAALSKKTELSGMSGVSIKGFILVGHSAGGQIGLLYGYKYHTKTKITACVSMAGPTDFTDDVGWSKMAMWGDDLETRLSFLSQVGSRLTGHAIKLTQSDWTKQKNYSEFRKHVLEISSITYVSETETVPPTLLVHARDDNQVPYSNAVRLRTALHNASIPHRLLTPTGSGNSHMLGGEVYTDYSPFIFRDQAWVEEAKKWIEQFIY